MANQFSRRGFIRTSSALSAGLWASGCKFMNSSPQKPNLLFIWTDEQRADTMAVYGNKKIKTPNLNRLAEQSFVFMKAYVTQPVSTPSRSSVLTGLYPHTSGLTSNNIPLPATTPCFPELLNDPDYKTAYMGKWHLGDEIFPQHGFENWVSIEDGYSVYYSEGRDPAARSDYHHWLVGKGYKPSENDNKFSRNFAASLPIEHCKPKFLEENACRFLEENQADPFVLYVNFLEPHMPFTGPLDEMYHPDDVDLPASFDDPLDENEPLQYRLKRENCMKKYGPDEENYRKLISKYWGLVTQVDRSVGAILDKLEQLGLAGNTIVVYTSDHGDMMGAHRLVEKSVMFEEATRIPFLMKVPFITSNQTIIPQRVSQIDIVPTLLELMGKPQSASLQGKSLAKAMRENSMPDEPLFIEWNSSNVNGRTVITPDGWKLCLSDNDHSQLFNLVEDPWETTNLFDNPAFSEKIGFLKGKIREWQVKTNDSLKIA